MAEETPPTPEEVAAEVQATVDKAAAKGNKVAKQIQRNIAKDAKRGK